MMGSDFLETFAMPESLNSPGARAASIEHKYYASFTIKCYLNNGTKKEKVQYSYT